MSKKGKKTRATQPAVANKTNLALPYLPPELLEMILVHLPLPFQLSSAQRVCRAWRETIKLLTDNFLMDSALPVGTCNSCPQRVVNPLLFQHFSPLFNDGSTPLDLLLTFPSRRRWLEGTGRHWLPDMTIAKTQGTRAVHEAFARRGASWRKMQISSPPIRQLQYRNGASGMPQTVTFEDGLRMGQLYDLVVEIFTQAKPDVAYSARVTWPVMQTCADNGECNERTADIRDYVRVEHVATSMSTPWCYEKHAPGNHESCYKDYRRKILARYISSNKWTFKCEEGGKENLVVNL